MAELLGTKRTTYANWENNTVPDMAIMTKISELTNTPVSQLMNFKDETRELEKSKEEIIKEIAQLKAMSKAIVHVLIEVVAQQRGVSQIEASQMITQKTMKYLTDQIGE